MNVQGFIDDMREKGIHVGVGEGAAFCAVDGEPWPCEVEKETRYRALAKAAVTVKVEAVVDEAEQLSILDAAWADRVTEQAIVEVELHADAAWKAEALSAVERVALAHERFTTDLVWVELAGITETTHEPRAMGAVMRRAVAAGWIEASDLFEPSERPETHRNPKRVWRSLIAQVAGQ